MHGGKNYDYQVQSQDLLRHRPVQCRRRARWRGHQPQGRRRHSPQLPPPVALVEPHCSNEGPESWAEIAEWEWKRAEFFTWLFVFRDIEEAIRRVP